MPLNQWPRIRALAATVVAATFIATGPSVAADDFQTSCSKPPHQVGRSFVATPSTFQKILRTVAAGDVVTLSAGDYGAATIGGENSGFVTVRVQPGQKATFSRLGIVGSHWIVSGVTVDRSLDRGATRSIPTPPGRWPAHDWLVRLRGDNLVLEQSTVMSRDGQFPWQAESLGQDDPTPLWNGVTANNASCITISNNMIKNVFNGVAVEGNQVGNEGKYFKVISNKITDFAGDGIDFSVSVASISNNTITNSHDVCNNLCVHTDAIQGWNFRNRLDIFNYDVTISGNTIIQRTVSNLPMTGDSLQGITIFDGFWKDLNIFNNVVIVDAWHGISIGGANGLRIVNNTVLPSSDRVTWIAAGATTHEGGISKNIIVENNISSVIQPIKSTVENVTVDHNILVKDPRSLFTRFDVDSGQFDLHLRPGVSARARGDVKVAPATDINGTPRSGKIDLGAYQSTTASPD